MYTQDTVDVLLGLEAFAGLARSSWTALRERNARSRYRDECPNASRFRMRCPACRAHSHMLTSVVEGGMTVRACRACHARFYPEN